MLARISISLGVLLVSTASLGMAEPAKETTVVAGHSMHGEAFNEGPRQKAYLMEATGSVHFAVTTTKDGAEAQRFFDQGLGQLHGFWYFEAERSFRQVLALDPQCAMAYWGMAMANTNNEKRAKSFIAKAKEQMGSLSPREKLWIEALHEYLHSTKERKQKRTAYIKALENIVQEHPDDVEARAYLALTIWQFKDDLPISSYQAVDALLDQVFASNASHPAHHYRIHLWDSEKPARAVKSAAQCGPAAPRIAHMWHMPGHTYSKLKRYADAAWQQEASSRADHAHMMHARILPDQIHNYAHNQEWLIRDLNFIGRARDSIALAKNMIELPRHPKYNTLEKSGSSSSFGRQRLLDTLETYELWDELLALSQTPYLEPTDVPKQQVIRLRATGMAHAGKSDCAPLDAVIAELQQLLDKEKSARELAVAKATDKARNDHEVTLLAEVEKKKARPQESSKADKKEAAKTDAKSSEDKLKDAVAKAKTEAEKAFSDRIADLEAALEELRAYRLLLSPDPKSAVAQLEKVKRLSKVRKAQLFARAGDKEKALELAKQAVDGAKNEILPLATYVHALHAAGKTEEAGKLFAELRTISGTIDSLAYPVFDRLKPVADALKLPADWREPIKPAADLGPRPPLDSIGPFRWSRVPAPAWSLPDADGRSIALDQFKGKPVVVMFYLGFGCPHCVDQLKAFAGKWSAFADAGIALVAIGIDDPAGVKQSAAELSKDLPFPIPLLSDAKMDAFRQYRAFDDFEQRPMHGAFLIDRQGRIAWQDISFEPFTNTDFLLGESKRLLSLPEPGPPPAGVTRLEK